MKHKFLSKRYWKDNSTAMGASEDKIKKYGDLINLSIGDTDLITDEIIINGAFGDAKLGHTRYTETRGDPELRQEIRNFYKEEYDMEVADKEIMVTTSGCIAMYLTLEAVLDDGDEVIIHTPCFTPYIQQIQLARGVPVEVASYEEDGFQPRAENIEAAITERTKAIIVNTPTNPTGGSMTQETLESIAQVAEKYDLLVIADDIYTLFSFEEEFMPFSSIKGMRERTVTINSFSKNFLMTGWRIGYIVAPDYIVKTIQNINENVAFSAPSISQRAGIYALRNRKAIQPAIYEEYKNRACAVAKKVNSIPNMSVLNPKGTFYLFVNIKNTGLTSEETAQRILDEAHVLLLPGSAFGKSGEGYLRVACTCGTEVLLEAFDRISRMGIFSKKD